MTNLFDSVAFNVVMLVASIVAQALNTFFFVQTGELRFMAWLLVNVLACLWFIYKLKSIITEYKQ